MEVVVHNDVKALKELLPSWKEIENASNELTIFQTLGWIENWWRIKCKKSVLYPYIIEVLKEGNTVGVFPLYICYQTFLKRKFRILRPMGTDFSDYLLPIIKYGTYTKEITDFALQKIFKDKYLWDFMEWDDMPEDAAYFTHMNDFLTTHKKPYQKISGAICPYISLKEKNYNSQDNYDSSFLKQIKSKQRRLMKKGEVIFEKGQFESEIEIVMNQLFRLHRKRWEHTNTPSSFQFKEERKTAVLNAKALFKDGLLHLTFLRFNKEIVAIHFGMSDNQKLYYYIPAYDTDYQKYSVGNILTYYLIESAVEEGLEVFDFLRGNEGYKRKFGAKSKRNATICFYNQTLKSRVYKKVKETYFSDKFNTKTSKNQMKEKIRVRLGIFTLFFWEKLLLSR